MQARKCVKTWNDRLMVLTFTLLEIHEKNNIKHKIGNRETFVLGPS